ncbi:MAG: family 16 glycoside hydrolase [Pirellulales bacterium]
MPRAFPLRRFSYHATRALALSAALLCGAVQAQDKSGMLPPPEGYTNTPIIPGQPWKVHDKFRPRPALVTPGAELGAPPSDAVVLFDGKNLDAWQASGKKGADGKPAPATWKIDDGSMVAVGGSGSLETREHFGDCQLHLEWSAPTDVKGKSQGRGNSGVIIMGRYEIQVLDSFDNDTYPDGQAASIYGQYPPQVNVTRKPGEWNAYDIIFEGPRFNGKELVKPARATVFHNGVLVQHARDLIGPMAHQDVAPYRPHPPTGPLVLQDHGNPVRFRNIWYRSLRTEQVPWLSIPGTVNPEKPLAGNGKKVVLIAGDEEYRSEEAMPQLAKILAKHHGFDTTVLFSTNPETGLIDPNYQNNIPGLHLLENADLMIIGTRFRELPDWQMQYIVDYCKAGKPVIGLRTATHAFAYSKNKESKFIDWSYNSSKWQGGFGQQVLGETWISHHGNHGSQSTRGVIEETNKANPILRGVKDVWGPTDVYGITHLAADATVLLRGQVLTGMKPEDGPVDGKQNTPMMPLAWLKSYQVPDGKPGQAVCTTMGAASDLPSADLRRFFVNAAYFLTGLEAKITDSANVDIVGKFEPSKFGFMREPNYWKDKNLTPASFAD